MVMDMAGYLSAVVIKANGERKQLATLKHNLLCNAGRDGFHALCYTNASGTYRAFYAVAVTESTITPAAGDTTLSGEITSNGLTRADATTHSHSAGTNSSTVEHTFTASGSFTDVKASATFNQATIGGTMAHIANFSTGSGTLAANDTLKVTWTLNLG